MSADASPVTVPPPGRTRPTGRVLPCMAISALTMDAMSETSECVMDDKPSRVAMISLHTSPKDQPGTGDAGGMNVYILSVARRLAEQGIAVDVFTRCAGREVPEVEAISPGSRVIQIQAGPCAPVSKEELPSLVSAFAGGVVEHAARDQGPHSHSPYDVVHSHYWLSGWVGAMAKTIWGVPHVASFHTLAKVKNEALAPGDRPEPSERLRGELRVVRGADRIVAPTSVEASELMGLYGAAPDRIRVVAPGVDRSLFVPSPKPEALERLGLQDRRLLLFVGRLQPLKGPDLAIRAFSEAVRADPTATAGAVLGVVGGYGSDGDGGPVARLEGLAADLGVVDRVLFFGPQPHARLADFYSAAEALLVPSRSESFGLVALESQACGTPVIAADTGGLRKAVRDGVTGFLVPGHDPSAYAAPILELLRSPALAGRMSLAARTHAADFSWDATASGTREVYREVTRRRAV